jgi:hypothetical protein
MEIENLTNLFQQTNIQPTVSDAFLTEINYICNSVISYYQQYHKIYTDVLEILCHCGHDLAYDVSDTFDEDCKWFGNYGKAYVYNYILTRVQIQNLEDYMNVNDLINKIKDIYNIP